MEGARVGHGSVLWTIGTGHRSLQELIGLLADARVRRLVDVRSYPKSHLPHLCRDSLARALAGHGLDYQWLGNDLGGLRKDTYQVHMTTPRFASGLARLQELARELPTAVCCAEIDAHRCHRWFIADALVERGWQVMHISGDGRIIPHESLPQQVGLPLAAD